jgi:nucleotide-binding universal stress UspA family protein
MYRSLLVPLDGSSFAEQALPCAAAIATRANAGVSLVRVWESPSHFVTELAPPAIREAPTDRLAAAAYLEETAEQLRRSAGIAVETAVLEGGVPRSILDHATTTGTDLIVMTTHGRTGFSRAWIGSVVDALVRSALVPLLLCRPDETQRVPPYEHVFSRLLIPLDGGTEAERILPHAIEIGRMFQAKYVLFCVVRPVAMPTHPYSYTAAAWQGDPAATEQAVEQADNYLRGCADRVAAQHAGACVEIDVRVNDSAAATIVHAAINHGADLIALTTHARRGVRVLLGSVADKVLRGTDAAVLALRPVSE